MLELVRNGNDITSVMLLCSFYLNAELVLVVKIFLSPLVIQVLVSQTGCSGNGVSCMHLTR